MISLEDLRTWARAHRGLLILLLILLLVVELLLGAYIMEAKKEIKIKVCIDRRHPCIPLPVVINDTPTPYSVDDTGRITPLTPRQGGYP
jgi:hypothetical protein